MKQYTSCFVGIPLPEKFQKEFERLLIDIVKYYPNWEIVYPKTPHITVYYLDKQSQFALPSIASVVQTKISILKNLVLTVNSFDYFAKDGLREGIVFLDIIYSSEFVDFNLAIIEKLGQYYSADNNLPFHPHMTVARVKDFSNVESLKTYISQIKKRVGKIHWDFPICEIVFYGVDSTKQPRHQEKLIHIPVR